MLTTRHEERSLIIHDAVKVKVKNECEAKGIRVKVIAYPQSISTFAVACGYREYDEYCGYVPKKKCFWVYFLNDNGGFELVETTFKKWPPKIQVKTTGHSSRSLNGWAQWLKGRKK